MDTLINTISETVEYLTHREHATAVGFLLLSLEASQATSGKPLPTPQLLCPHAHMVLILLDKEPFTKMGDTVFQISCNHAKFLKKRLRALKHQK